MKKLLVGLLALGSYSAIAQNFDGVKYRGSLVLASSNVDAVCRALTEDLASEAALVGYVKVNAGGRFIKIKKDNEMISKSYSDISLFGRIMQGGTYTKRRDTRKIINFLSCEGEDSL